MVEPTITISVEQYNFFIKLRYSYYCEMYDTLHEVLLQNCRNWGEAQQILNKYKEFALIEQSKIIKE